MLCIAVTTSCRGGVHTETIIGKYVYTDSGSYSRYIDYNSKRIIDDIVIRHAHDDKYIYALRQITNHYICNPNDPEKISSRTEVTNTFEYWIVDILSGAIYGPLDQSSFSAFVALSGENKKLPLATVDEVLKSHSAVYPTVLSDCEGAELIDHFKLNPRKVGSIGSVSIDF